MTERQEQHLQGLIAKFARLADAKYRAGAAEHGDDLLDSPVLRVLKMGREEAIDAFIYNETAIELEEKRLRGDG